MFPLKDENPSELTPIITFVLIGLCSLTWLLIQGAGFTEEALMASVCEYGAIPFEITGRAAITGFETGQPLVCAPGSLTWQALLTSMFLHGSWMHLIGNMWFLWVFGNNIEDSMGHGRFIAFYLLTGLIASLVHVYSDPGSAIPTVGASGAISGIMGAYLVLYPKVRVQVLLVLFVIIRVIPLPAWVMLGYWFVLQIVSSAATPTGGGGVAFGAHIGGFVAGVALIKLFARPQLVTAKNSGVVLDRRDIRGGGW